MKVLVVGGTRFMGKHLVNSLLAIKHDVTILTRGITPDDFGEKVKRIVVDRTDSDSVKIALSGHNYDIIFDSLAYCSNDVKIILDAAICKKYIFISSLSVYEKIHLDIKEEDFDPLKKPLIWCNRDDYPYDEIKRQAECAAFQKYAHIKLIAVRLPYVIGVDDYTKRLYFYIEHIMSEKPISIDNYESQMAFVRSDEAGKFLSFLANTDFTGTINGASEQTISIKEVADYIKVKTGKSAVLSTIGEAAPYNDTKDYSINVDKAKSLGFSFSPLRDWIFDLIDEFIDEANRR
jgi:nucleoside-diphosphate-sugar epimerase